MTKQIIVLVAALAFLTSAAQSVPIIDTVFVGDKEWAQVDLFLSLSGSDIDAVCPGGVCGAGMLNSNDMAGWTWASNTDVDSLVQSYGVAGLTSLISDNVKFHSADGSCLRLFC